MSKQPSKPKAPPPEPPPAPAPAAPDPEVKLLLRAILIALVWKPGWNLDSAVLHAERVLEVAAK